MSDVPQALAETITHSPRESGDALAIRADALRAEAWAGEPFLRSDEDPHVVLAPGTARRRALDDGSAELEAGRDEPRPSGRCATRSCSGSSASSPRSRRISPPAPSSAAIRWTRSPECSPS